MWVGSLRYFFTPGRDVIVGHGGHCDIRLDRPGLGGVEDASQPVPDLVLRFAGTHWLAVDQSQHGLFVDGTRLSTVDIRDGQTIALGDAERGPRLTFQVSAADDPAAAASATDPHGVALPPESRLDGEPATAQLRAQPEAEHDPETTRIPAQPVVDEPETTRLPAQTPPTGEPEPTTGRIPVQPPPVADEPATTRIPMAPLDFSGTEQSPMERPTRPFRFIRAEPAVAPSPPPVTPPVPPAPAPVDLDKQPEAPGLISRMSEATRKLLPAQDEPAPGEFTRQTGRLPLLQSGARTIGVTAHQLGLTLDGHPVLADVSFTTRPGSLIAVVGPSAARNFALTAVLAGTRPLTSGVLTVDGRDVHGDPAAMRTRIGVVPRDNRVHLNLTVERALGYAAELRLPSNTTVENRTRIVEQVLDELELTPHRKTKVAKLPPELRRCASLAVELLARPTMLVVDEPAAGLDPQQEHHLMTMLRRQADLGCVVVMAVTSPGSLGYLSLCDQVLVLTPAGRLAFAGPPAQLESVLGTTDWSQIFARVAADPDGAHHAFQLRQQEVAPPPPSVAHPERTPPALSFGQQVRLVVRRQVRMVSANPVQGLFLLLLPVALGCLTLLIPGNSGLGRAGSSSSNTHEAVEILAALNFGAVLLGTTATISALVSERRVFRRDQQVGLSASAYLLGKIVVFGVVAAVQAAILSVIVLAGKGGPRHGAVLLGSADFELYVSVAATAVVSAIVGLALSSLGRSVGEAVALAVPALLASLLFAGGLMSLVGTWVYDQVSWFIPAQWGFAAAASTVNLRRVDKLAAQNAMWAHYSGWWVFDMLMLAVLGLAWAGLVRYRLRVPATSPTARTG